MILCLAGEQHYEAAGRKFGSLYAEGFAHGFDGAPVPREQWSSEADLKRVIEGHRDGEALWAAVRDGVSPVPDFPPNEWSPETIPSGAPAAP